MIPFAPMGTLRKRDHIIEVDGYRCPASKYAKVCERLEREFPELERNRVENQDVIFNDKAGRGKAIRRRRLELLDDSRKGG